MKKKKFLLVAASCMTYLTIAACSVDGNFLVTNEAGDSVQVAVYITEPVTKIHSFYQIIHPGDQFCFPILDILDLNNTRDVTVVISQASYESGFRYPPRSFVFSTTEIEIMKQTRYLSVVIRAPGDCFVISKVFQPRDKHKNSLEENDEQEIFF